MRIVAHPRSQGVRYAPCCLPSARSSRHHPAPRSENRLSRPPPVAVGARRSDPPDRPTGRPVSPTARTLRGAGHNGLGMEGWLPGRPAWRPRLASTIRALGRAGLRHPTALQHARIGGHVGGLFEICWWRLCLDIRTPRSPSQARGSRSHRGTACECADHGGASAGGPRCSSGRPPAARGTRRARTASRCRA